MNAPAENRFDDASFTLHGAGVSGGIAIGYAHLVSSARLEVAHYEVAPGDIETEIRRFEDAIRHVRGELIQMQAGVANSAPAEIGAFLNVHRMILDDAHLSQVPRDLIRSRRCNAEWALVQQMDALVAQFEEIEDVYLRERKNDIVQVVERVLKAMLGSANAPVAPTHEENVIVVAHDLSPFLEWYERDERDGIEDMPYPPDYPKMKGEPKRVQPSRARAEDD